jgi:succinate-semialdehyde dehydrogenase/glutarate-semialdehyde dehydrogenase
VYDEWLELFADHMAKLPVGDPTSEDTRVGPLARPDLRDDLHSRVMASVAARPGSSSAARLPRDPGAFYPPTILVDVGPAMPAYDTAFGLGAAVFTQDLDRSKRIAAEQIEAVTCVVDTFVASDPRLPFDGIKQSGFGRELADLGIGELVNHKTVIVD